jgi:hypothetical protein
MRSGTGQDHSVPHIPLSYNHSASGSSSSGSNRSGRGRSGLPSGPGFQVDFTANFTVDPFTFRHATALPDRAIKFMTMTPHTALPLITLCIKSPSTTHEPLSPSHSPHSCRCTVQFTGIGRTEGQYQYPRVAPSYPLGPNIRRLVRALCCCRTNALVLHGNPLNVDQ